MRNLCALALILVLVLMGSIFTVAGTDGLVSFVGEIACNLKMYPIALKIWHPQAAQGNKFSQFSIGQLYYFGNGVKQDYTEAVKWWRKAADQGEFDAQNYLSFMYEHGEGVKQDYVEAYYWNALATKQRPEVSRIKPELIARLTADQLSVVNKRISEWKPSLTPTADLKH